MLSREKKCEIILSFPNIIQKENANDRIKFDYEASKAPGKEIIRQLSYAGNGYINAKYMSHGNGYTIDPRGWINIKEFSEDELRTIIKKVIESMSK
jgi:hypothetical protein